MKKVFIVLGVVLLGAALFYFNTQKSKNVAQVGLVIPLENRALRDMSQGFVEQLKTLEGDKVVVSVKNAQGDRAIMRSIIEQFKRQNVKAIATIGTEATLLAASKVDEIPIVGLDVTSHVTQEQKNITGIQEGSVIPSFEIIKDVIKDLKKLTVIYSNSEKISQQIMDLKKLADQEGITLQTLMVQNISEIYTISKHVDPSSQALFILKDIAVASGATTLAKAAEDLKIPFISCDEGSVISGGAMALGNREYDIGKEGADQVQELLKGKAPHQIPLKPADTFVLFLNSTAAKKQGLDEDTVKSVAALKGYQLVMVTQDGAKK